MKTQQCDWCLLDADDGIVRLARHIVGFRGVETTHVCSRCLYVHYCTAFEYTFDGGNQINETNFTITGDNPDYFVAKFDRKDFEQKYGVSHID